MKKIINSVLMLLLVVIFSGSGLYFGSKKQTVELLVPGTSVNSVATNNLADGPSLPSVDGLSTVSASSTVATVPVMPTLPTVALPKNTSTNTVAPKTTAGTKAVVRPTTVKTPTAVAEPTPVAPPAAVVVPPAVTPPPAPVTQVS